MPIVPARYGLVAALLVALAGPALAQPRSYASASISVSGGACEEIETGSPTATVRCGGNYASAGPGFLRATAHAFGISTTESFQGNSPVTAGAQFWDELQFQGVRSGTLRIPLAVSGRIIFRGNIAHPPAGYYFRNIGSLGVGVGHAVRYRSRTYMSTTREDVRESDGDDVFDLEIVDGRASLWVSASAYASCDLLVAGGVGAFCESLVEYGSSVYFLGATVLDTAGTPRDDVAVTAASGFDYLRGVSVAAAAPPAFVGGGVVFAQTSACLPVFGAQPRPVTIRYNPVEFGGDLSELTVNWPDGSEHLALWQGEFTESAQFVGGAGRQTWTRFVFYPTRPLIRVVQRQSVTPEGAVSLADADEIILRLRVQNFAGTPGCAATITAALRQS